MAIYRGFYNCIITKMVFNKDFFFTTFQSQGLFQLLKGEDGTKDQSYFLYRLNQEQLSRTVFPLGDMYKNEVRAIAKRLGLANHDKKDSTGICFIGERIISAFNAMALVLMRLVPPRHTR